MRAAGLTPVEVQRAIEAALKDKAIEPQVIVTVTSSPSTFVTVAGDVGKPGRLPLNLGGDRVLDVIATSGGTTAADYNTFVRLTRGSSSATVSLARIVRDNDQNIYPAAERPPLRLYRSADLHRLRRDASKRHRAVHHRSADAGGGGRRRPAASTI